MDYSLLIGLCERLGVEHRLNEPLNVHTTMKIGGECDIFVCPRGEEAAAEIVRFCIAEKIPYFVLGRGSNVLVSSKGYRGCIICLCGTVSRISVSGNFITADAGAGLLTVCRAALENSLSGLEFAAGIPGSIGGALYMNAGAYGGEMKDIVRSCRYIDENGALCEMTADEMELSYRHSVFSVRKCVILSVTMELRTGNKEQIQARIAELMAKRREKQPLEYPSCGSTFKRPEGYFAAALIEECGLKGFSVGGAQVSEKHSGFVINRENASYEDVVALVEHIKRTVREQKGVELECEMLTLGERE